MCPLAKLQGQTAVSWFSSLPPAPWLLLLCKCPASAGQECIYLYIFPLSNSPCGKAVGRSPVPPDHPLPPHPPPRPPTIAKALCVPFVFVLSVCLSCIVLSCPADCAAGQSVCVKSNLLAASPESDPAVSLVWRPGSASVTTPSTGTRGHFHTFAISSSSTSSSSQRIQLNNHPLFRIIQLHQLYTLAREFPRIKVLSYLTHVLSM